MAAKQEHHQQHSSLHGDHHFLVVAYGVQSHVNPGRSLAHRLAGLNHIDGRSILAKFSVPVTAQRRLFPSPDGGGEEDKEACSDHGVISYFPHSDGTSGPKTAEDWARRHCVTAKSLSAIIAHFAAGGKPVTCIVLTMAGPALVDVVRRHGIPFAVCTGSSRPPSSPPSTTTSTATATSSPVTTQFDSFLAMRETLDKLSRPEVRRVIADRSLGALLQCR